MRAITSGQQAILDGTSPGIVALLMLLDHPDGAIRMSSLAYDWTDAATDTWTGGAAVLDFGPTLTRAGVSGGAVSVTWNGADAALLSAAQDGKIAGRRLTRYLAFINPAGAQVDGLWTEWRGICETPAINADPNFPTITLTAESMALRLGRPRPVRMTPGDQERWFTGDTGFDFVAALQNANPFG